MPADHPDWRYSLELAADLFEDNARRASAGAKDTNPHSGLRLMALALRELGEKIERLEEKMRQLA